MPYFTLFDPTYLFLVVPAIVISMIAQFKVKSAFSKYSQVHSLRKVTGAEACRRILNENGLSHIRVEYVDGYLSDHYDPKNEVIRLSDRVYNSTSVAAIGVAAHEAGHAVQYGVGYFPIKVRNMIIPITRIGSNLTMPLILIGLITSMGFLINLGLIFFMAVVIFQLITLPVEFNASRRAINTIRDYGILELSEIKGAKSVLTAAAMTYVAALLVALANFLRLLILFGNRGRRN